MHFATLNLYQYAEPGTFWYERGADNDHSPERWAAKQDWIVETLQAADAEVVGVQEVFSIGSLRALAARAGYPHVAVVAEPARAPEDPDIFLGPVVALLSRHPFVDAPTSLRVPPGLFDDVPLALDFGFRRDVVRAKVDLPGLGPTTVMSAHFKSQGAFIDGDAVAALPDWRARFRDHLRQRASRDAEQLIRRTGEAASLYLATMEEVAPDRNAPVVILGDLNDTPDSATLRIATQYDWIQNIAGRRYDRVEPPSERAWSYAWRLYDAYRLRPDQSGVRSDTHAGGWHYGPSVLDYVLVSNGLNPENPDRKGTVVDHRVVDAHLEDGRDLGRSDHALVRVTVEA